MTKATPVRENSRVVKEIKHILDSADERQIEIAHKMGLKNANLLTMIKKGTTKIPASMIVPLCEATQRSPHKLINLYIHEYLYDLKDILVHIKNEGLSEDEEWLLETFRDMEVVLKKTKSSKAELTKSLKKIAH